MAEIRSVCVYCGSAQGREPVFGQVAERFGRLVAGAGLTLVYGGGSVGLMGTVARAALMAGGHVTGIIPRFLVEREVMLNEVSELIVTEDMHERKRLMFERSDAFVALPGGIGTLEEVVEMMTWAQLGRHRKPVVLADVGDFWQPLAVLLDHMRDHGFIRPGFEVNYRLATDVDDILPMLGAAVAATPAERLAGRNDVIDRL